MNEIYAAGNREPLCDEEEFADLVAEMVHDEAPGLFAVVQEFGEREEGRIAAWGMAFADHTAVLRGRSAWLHLSSPDRARQLLSRAPDVTARLVWVRIPLVAKVQYGTLTVPDKPFTTPATSVDISTMPASPGHHATVLAHHRLDLPKPPRPTRPTTPPPVDPGLVAVARRTR